MSAAKYPASRSSLTFPSVTEEAIHLPCTPDPDMAGVFGQDGKVEEEEGVGEKDGSLSLYKGNEYQAPPHKP